MIQNLSENVIMPIAGLLLTFIAVTLISNIGMNIGIDKFYDAMANGRSYDELFL